MLNDLRKHLDENDYQEIAAVISERYGCSVTVDEVKSRNLIDSQDYHHLAKYVLTMKALKAEVLGCITKYGSSLSSGDFHLNLKHACQKIDHLVRNLDRDGWNAAG